MMYELQPLRIQAGWMVEYNNFSEYDMSIHGNEDIYELNEDLLQLSNKSADLIIDLGWYPSHNEEGKYILMLIKEWNWNSPLEMVETQDKKEIIKYIEKWTCHDFWQKYK